MNKRFKQLIELLIKEKFEDLGGPDGVVIYDNNFMQVWVDSNDNTLSIEFLFAQDGFYKIKNATTEQVEQMISISKSIEFIPLEEGGVPNKAYNHAIKNMLIEIVEQYVYKKQKQ